MPKVNIYSQKALFTDRFEKVLRPVLASSLSVKGKRELSEKDFSFRFIPNQKALSNDFEIEILAHSYKKRVKKSDKICRKIVAVITEEFSNEKDFDVALNLVKMGYAKSKKSI